MIALLVVSHGSHSPQTKIEVQALVENLRKRRIADFVDFAFLEIEKPSISEGIDALVAQGAKRIKVVLNFLNSGKHVDVDIPKIVAAAQAKYPQVALSITTPVGQHPKIIDLFCDIAS